MSTCPDHVDAGKEFGHEGRFSLGRFGLPVNILAVPWGGGMVTNPGWPRRVVYNATPPYHRCSRWSAVLFVSVVVLGGFGYYWFRQRHRTGVLSEHAAPGGTDTAEDAAAYETKSVVS
ncbi:hypothetical protein FHX42_003344 [Saccharopolyspora lacisalsi]|uniref:Uncharacterized protein n=1 Tax=Halosaccharopolyspora lacisalsi TaxID=1000566 RepID=A0A839E4Z4_9PSEU|nr:hypothetical protein [Halosaccharopolyspora lacisalsi]MBA8825978.1 hypothetical protein [Halosaccharopolyspora lacisalsi]